MKPPRAEESLEISVSAYKRVLAEYKAHESKKSAALDRLIPAGKRNQFQKYLDQRCDSPVRTADGELYLPVLVDSKLQEWGLAIENELADIHEQSSELRKSVYEHLTRALYCLGAVCVDWIAPRADKTLYEGMVKPAFAIGSEYRKNFIDGISVLTTDGPFVSGLSKRLGIKPADIYKANDHRVSAFEMAYWAVSGDQAQPNEISR